MKKEDLIKAANELNDLFFEAGDPQKINVESAEKILKSGIAKSCKLLENGDQVSDTVKKILKGLIDENIYSDLALQQLDDVLGIKIHDDDKTESSNHEENGNENDVEPEKQIKEEEKNQTPIKHSAGYVLRKRRKKSGVNVSNLIYRFTYEYPDMSANDIVNEINKKEINISLATVKMRMYEMRRCLEVLIELGVIE
jgi:hypothetical protein